MFISSKLCAGRVHAWRTNKLSDQSALCYSRGRAGGGGTKSRTNVVACSWQGLRVLASKSTGKHLHCYFVTSDGKTNETQSSRNGLPCSLRARYRTPVATIKCLHEASWIAYYNNLIWLRKNLQICLSNFKVILKSCPATRHGGTWGERR
jgi:hypothetical protein